MRWRRPGGGIPSCTRALHFWFNQRLAAQWPKNLAADATRDNGPKLREFGMGILAREPCISAPPTLGSFNGPAIETARLWLHRTSSSKPALLVFQNASSLEGVFQKIV